MEILTEIIALIILADSKSTNILSCSRLLRSIARRILHTHLCFYSSTQLSRFAGLMCKGSLSLACEPQSIMLDIAGGASFGIFDGLHAVLTQIVLDPHCKQDENGRVALELLGLKLNSLTYADHRLIFTSLSRAK